MTHKNEEAFEGYHWKIPYIQDFINVIGKSKDATKPDNPRIGAKTSAKYICAKYQSEIIEVVQSEGIAISGDMDEISAAAMWTDPCVTKSQ